MITIEKTFRFEAAHRLMEYDKAKCGSLHGHSWTLTVQMRMRDRTQLDDMGMVKDYAEIGKFKKWIDNKIDHATILHAKDKHLRDLLNRQGDKVYCIAGNPTSENLASHLAQVASTQVNDKRTMVTQVTISETCTTSCTVVTDRWQRRMRDGNDKMCSELPGGVTLA